MDNSQGARKQDGESEGVRESTAQLSSEKQTPTVVDAVRTVKRPSWRRRPRDASDPEATEELPAHNGSGAGESRPPAAPTGSRVPPQALERTDPVQRVAGKASPRHLPDFSELLPIELAEKEAPSTSEGVLTAGTVLAGRYVILEEAEHSGMGLVYKALDRQRERAGSPTPWVALKIGRPASSDRSDTTGNLRHEFLKLSELRHRNIVAVYDFGIEGGIEFMVLEWLQGETLASLLDNLPSKRMASRAAEDIVRSLAAALAHAHAAGIVHGDVKPSNIFITHHQVVKLLDFGATTRSSPGRRGDDDYGWATRAYASCDVLLGKPPTPSDDVFALGVTAYRLLSGERPFGDRDALAAREEGLAPPDLPLDAVSSWPAVRTALELDAARRQTYAAEFLRQLEDEGESAKPAAFPHPVPPHLTAIAWAVLGASVLALSVWWSLPEEPATPPRVEGLLQDAVAAVAAGRLLEPADDNAVAHYAAVLEEEPGNEQAEDGLDAVAERFLDDARTALAAERYDEARASLDRARQVRPDHFGIVPIEDLLARYRRDLLVSARQTAAIDLDRAERYLAQAAELSAANDPGIADAREVLQRERTSARLEAMVRAIDERILSERLLLPSGDSAVDLLRRAANFAPGDRQVQLARDRIASALLFQAMFSISNGNLDEAGTFIDAAKSLSVRHLALARAEYELAKARSDALGPPGSRGR